MSSPPPYPLPPITEALNRCIRPLILALMRLALPPLAAGARVLPVVFAVGVGVMGSVVLGRSGSDSRGIRRSHLICRRFAGSPNVPPQVAAPGHPERTDHARRRRPAGHGRRSAHGVQRDQARALQGPGGLGGAELPAQAGRHPGARRGSPGGVLGHRRRHERQPRLHRRQAAGRHRLRLVLRQGAAGRGHPHRGDAGRAQPPAARHPQPGRVGRAGARPRVERRRDQREPAADAGPRSSTAAGGGRAELPQLRRVSVPLSISGISDGALGRADRGAQAVRHGADARRRRRRAPQGRHGVPSCWCPAARWACSSSAAT